MASAIQAIGRCASNIPEVTDTCLSGLVKLLSNRDGMLINLLLFLVESQSALMIISTEQMGVFLFCLLETVVAESVVMIKKLLQLKVKPK